MIRSDPARLIGFTEIPDPAAICLAWSSFSTAITCSASARAGLVLDAGVEILGVLADDDEIDVVVAGADAGVGLARAAGTA